MDAEALLERKGFALSAVTCGKSMRPLIWGGAHRVALTLLDGEPAVGDILVFKHPQHRDDRPAYIVHRLVEIRGEGAKRLYITRGDNCVASEAVRREEIIGRVAEVLRTGGFRPWHAIWKRRFAVTDRSYRIYTRVWMAAWPARRIVYALRYSLLRRLRAKRLRHPKTNPAPS